MPTCKTIRGVHRKICIGDLDKRVKLQNVVLKPSTTGVDASRDFTDVEEVFAMIKTVKGKTFFNNVGTAIDITHQISILFRAGITDENWIEFDSRRFDILDFQDLDERKEFWVFDCNDRGDKARLATGA